MATVDINLSLEYPDSFDFEDVRTLMHSVLSAARSRGELDLPGAENSDNPGVKIECTGIGRVWPDWQD